MIPQIERNPLDYLAYAVSGERQLVVNPPNVIATVQNASKLIHEGKDGAEYADLLLQNVSAFTMYIAINTICDDTQYHFKLTAGQQINLLRYAYQKIYAFCSAGAGSIATCVANRNADVGY